MGLVILSSSSPPITQEEDATGNAQDFENRMSGDGVGWGHDFTYEAEVDNFRFIGGYGIDPSGTQDPDQNFTYDTTETISGNGCLKAVCRAGLGSGHQDGTWWRHFSAFASPGNGLPADDPAANGTLTVRTYDPSDPGAYDQNPATYGHSSVGGTEGSEFWIQVRMKIGASRADLDNPPGKIFVIDYGVGANQEIVIQSGNTDTNGDKNRLAMYSNFGLIALDSNSPVGDGFQQPGAQYGATSSYANVVNNPGAVADGDCWGYTYDEWFTLLLKITPGRSGVAETGIEVWAALDTEWEYKKVWDKRNYSLSYNSPNAWSTFKFEAYMNNVAPESDIVQKLGQVIFSREYIPCPMPSTATAPTWFVEQGDKTWSQPVSNTAEDVGAVAEHFNSWSGGTLIPGTGEVWIGAAGGGNSTNSNAVYGCVLKTESPAWVQRRAGSTASGGSSGNGDWGDGRPRPCHTYSNVAYGNGRVWMAPMTAGPGEINSNRIFAFNPTANDWITSLGSVSLSVGGSSGKEGWLAFDPVSNFLYGGFQLSAGQIIHKIDAVTGVGTATNIFNTGAQGFGQYSAAAVAPAKRALVVLCGASATAFYTDGASSPSLVGRVVVVNLDATTAGPIAGAYVPTITNPGSGPPFVSIDQCMGLVWDDQSSAFFCWLTGQNIFKLKMNGDPFTGTYTWSTVTSLGGSSVGTQQTNGTYGRFNYIPNMGNGYRAFTLVNAHNGPVSVFKIPPGELS